MPVFVLYVSATLSIALSCGETFTDPVTGYTNSGCATSFPHATVLGASFNRTLWRTVGNAIGNEGRAL